MLNISKALEFLQITSKVDPELPWLDRPNPRRELLEQLQQGKISSEQFDLLLHWNQQGYIVLNDIFPELCIDRLINELGNLFFLDAPIDGLLIEGIAHEGMPGVLPHRDILSLDLASRQSLLNSFWRIHSYHECSKSAKAIFDNSDLRKVVSLILGRECVPSYSINFMHGTEQDLHEDMAVFFINPANYLVGVWIALEDITEEQGPLVFCPGSHKDASVKDFFENYPQTNLKNCAPEKYTLYSEFVKSRAQMFPKKHFIARKGDVLLWHGMLIHGGAKISNPSLTRKSMVIHYIGTGCDCIAEAKGPFNW